MKTHFNWKIGEGQRYLRYLQLPLKKQCMSQNAEHVIPHVTCCISSNCLMIMMIPGDD